jgi:hypothetical protein
MTKQLKFVDGVYGFVYDSIHGHVSKVFREPVSEIEAKAMNKVIGEDDVLFVVGDEDDIREMFDLDNSPDLDEFSDAGSILEWK